MDRRSFLKLTPPSSAAAVTGALVLREDGKEPIELDVSVLKIQDGDTLVLSAPQPVGVDTAQRIQGYIEHVFPKVKAIILADGLKLEGVIRQ